MYCFATGSKAKSKHYRSHIQHMKLLCLVGFCLVLSGVYVSVLVLVLIFTCLWACRRIYLGHVVIVHRQQSERTWIKLKKWQIESCLDIEAKFLSISWSLNCLMVL